MRSESAPRPNSLAAQPHRLPRRSLLQFALLAPAAGTLGLVACTPQLVTGDTYLSRLNERSDAETNFATAPELMVQSADRKGGAQPRALAYLTLAIDRLPPGPAALQLVGRHHRDWAAEIDVFDVAALGIDGAAVDVRQLTWAADRDRLFPTAVPADAADTRLVDGAAPLPYQWDVTQAVAAARDRGAPTVTLAVAARADMAEPASFASLEAADAALQPALLAQAAAPDRRIQVQAKAKTDNSFRTYLAKTVATLPAAATEPPTGPYGGLSAMTFEATGYFRTQRGGDPRLGAGWTLIDPDGHPFYAVGLASVRPPTDPPDSAAEARWASEATTFLAQHGFNCTGGFSADAALTRAERRLPYAPVLSVMNSFGSSLGLTKPTDGNLRFRAHAMPVWHPEFADFARAQLTERLAEHAGDPWLLGYHLDNELPAHTDALLNLLTGKGGANDPRLADSQREARAFIAARGANLDPRDPRPSDEDAGAWLGHVYERYYAVVAPIFRELAGQHLLLGTRMHARAVAEPTVVAAAGRYADVLSFNYYGRWGVRRNELDMWAAAAPDTPALITEFYTKADDAGLDPEIQDGGAGWIVPNQEARGLAYQNSTIDLLAHPHTVGWHLFKYQDAPAQSNRGLLNTAGAPHEAYAAAVTELNSRAYAIREQFQRR